jgi:tetratricopeptide (TPR) repeat protein
VKTIKSGGSKQSMPKVRRPTPGSREADRQGGTKSRAGKAQPRRSIYIILIGLFVATSAVYAQTVWFGFTDFDDPAYVTANDHIRTGLSTENLVWAFRIDKITGNWHPLTWVSLMMDASLFQGWAGGYHLVNLGLHIANALLLFAILTSTTGLFWRAGLVAALFALHPQHVESVAWISERKDVLSTLFLMLTILAYVWYTRGPGIKRYAVVLIAFAMGLMAKAMLVSVPLLLLLLDWWPLGRLSLATGDRIGFPHSPLRTLLIEKLPLAALAVASGFVTKMAQDAGGTVTSSDVIPLASRAGNAVMSYGIYIAKTFWPTRLACYYPHPLAWPVWETAFLLTALTLATLSALRLFRTLPCLIVGWLWYGISLVPVIGLVQVGLQARADRYSYVPLIGIFIIVAYGIPELLLNPGKGSPARRKAISVCAVAALAALGIASYRQAGYWKDSVSLYSHALAVTRDNWFAHNGMGVTLRQEAQSLADSGNTQGAVGKYRAALGHFREVIRILPQYADAHNSLATCLTALGNHDEALAELRKTISIEPRHVLARSNLGNALYRRGNVEEAMEHYRQAILLDPNSAGAHYNLGIALTGQNRLNEAETEFRTVLMLQPEPYFAYWTRNKLAILLQLQGNRAEAIRLLEQAVRISDATGVDAISGAARKNLVLFHGIP